MVDRKQSGIKKFWLFCKYSWKFIRCISSPVKLKTYYKSFVIFYSTLIDFDASWEKILTPFEDYISACFSFQKDRVRKGNIVDFSTRHSIVHCESGLDSMVIISSQVRLARANSDGPFRGVSWSTPRCKKEKKRKKSRHAVSDRVDTPAEFFLSFRGIYGMVSEETNIFSPAQPSIAPRGVKPRHCLMILWIFWLLWSYITGIIRNTLLDASRLFAEHSPRAFESQY